MPRLNEQPPSDDVSETRVWMVPSPTAGNPYLNLLAGALERSGVRVELQKGSRPVAGKGRGQDLPDVVHLHWHHRFFVPGAGRYLNRLTRSARFFRELHVMRRRGVRVVWTVHNLVNHERVGVRWELACARRLAGRVDAIIAHCEVAADMIRTTYETDTPVEVIPHGNYIGAYPDAPERAAARALLGMDPGGKVLLFFGQIRAYKGVERLVEAFGAMNDPSLQLILAGQSKDEALADSLAVMAEKDDRLILEPAFVENDRLSLYLAAADAVVLPYSDSLTSGSAILAASAGRAAVMPSVGCLAEFPTDAAWHYEPGTTDGLRLALESAAADSDADAVGRRARSHVSAWDWDEVARRTMAVYEQRAT